MRKEGGRVDVRASREKGEKKMGERERKEATARKEQKASKLCSRQVWWEGLSSEGQKPGFPVLYLLFMMLHKDSEEPGCKSGTLGNTMPPPRLFFLFRATPMEFGSFQARG